MSLYIEQRGQGPDMVLLHGWGLHGGVFSPIIESLEAHFRLHLVDLPGHGRSPLEGLELYRPGGRHSRGQDYSLEALARSLAAALPPQAIWLGWSLGGRIAMAAAALGLPVGKLVLVGSNPCFRQRPDWPHAMSDSELQQFAHSLQDDYRATLQRFIALQSRGSSQGRDELRRLRELLFAHGEPDPEALNGALGILRDGDLRPALPGIQQPSLVLHGSRDTLAPLAAAEYLASQLPNAVLQVIDGAGHAPFISHPDAFIQAILDWHRNRP